ncbi:MAG: glycosyltransferase family 4 protein [Ignavibacteriae bacterium]|nr:glycosyltransferase family 4 protein [Ignavibacteriota bacterium]
MTNKRACIISKFLYENDTRLQQQVSILSQNNFSVEVICQLEEKRNISIKKNVRVYGVSTPGAKDTILEYIGNTIRFALPAFYYLQKLNFSKKFDIIIVHTLPELLVFITIFQKIFGTKVILDIRDTSVELFDSKWSHENRKLLRKLVVFFANLSCSIADKILVASPGFKEKLLERNIPKEKITVVFNSADTNIFRFDSQRIYQKIEKDLKIIYHGSIAERFGIDIAVESMKYITEKIPNAILNIYGFYDKAFKVRIKELIGKLKLENNVFLNDRESLENIYLKIKESDIGIVPYINDFFMQLAFSTKLFEYVASGIPVVTSRLKPAESVFNDESLFFVAARDSRELADMVIYISQHPDLREKQVKNAYEDYAKISSEIMNKRFLDVLNGISN